MVALSATGYWLKMNHCGHRVFMMAVRRWVDFVGRRIFQIYLVCGRGISVLNGLFKSIFLELIKLFYNYSLTYLNFKSVFGCFHQAIALD